jgi:hypothetical protein
MMIPLRTTAIATLLALCGSTAQAAQVLYVGRMSGPAESPPNSSTATGLAFVTLDDIAQTMQVQVTFSDLSSNDTAALIHCCTASPGISTAGVATLIPAFPGFPLGVTAGASTSMLDLTLYSSYNAAFVTANTTVAAAEATLTSGIAADRAYLNIHTTNYPGGEIRAFLIPDKIFANGVDSP